MKRIRILGSGVAALCCARALAERGWTVRLCSLPAPDRPVLVLNRLTVALLADLFCDVTMLRRHGHELKRRRVLWGTAPDPEEIAEPTLALRGDDLVEGLLSLLMDRHGHQITLEPRTAITADQPEDGTVLFGEGAAWTVAEGVAPAPARRHRWGERKVLAVELPLHTRHDVSTSWVESVPGGWVFMVPTGPAMAMVQAMVPALQSDPRRQVLALLADTREIGALVGELPGAVTVFEAGPSLSDTLCRPGWIAIGGQAVRLDPLCGDGTGYAARTAILAACVVDGISAGLPIEACLAHYEARLHTALVSHLRACRSFYDAGRFDATWDGERDATRRGLAWLEEGLATWPGFRMGVKGFTLAPLTSIPGRGSMG